MAQPHLKLATLDHQTDRPRQTLNRELPPEAIAALRRRVAALSTRPPVGTGAALDEPLTAEMLGRAGDRIRGRGRKLSHDVVAHDLSRGMMSVALKRARS